MNTTTPKSCGINYAKLRKQKYKEDTIPKSMSNNNIKFDVVVNQQQQQHSILKHRSTSQHNINTQQNQMSQIQLFDQYFNQSKNIYESNNSQKNDDNFIDFVSQSIDYHSQPIQPFKFIFRTQVKKWNEDKLKLNQELKRYQQENIYLQQTNQHLKSELGQYRQKYESLKLRQPFYPQSNNYNYNYNYSHYGQYLKNVEIPLQETISSLTDERFESNETHLNSSFSNDENQMSPTQIIEMTRAQSRKSKISKC